MILTERTINIIDHESIMDSPVVLYRGDKNVELKLNIKESRFQFRDDDSTNLIETAQASYGQLIIQTPNQNEPIFSEVTATKKGYIIFVITAEMIDEIDEVGNYTFQVRLLDSNKRSRATIPPVVNGIEIREPITSEDSNTLNSAVVGLASAANEEVLDTFDEHGDYAKTNWNFGDKITAAKLNKAEDGIYQSYALGLNNSSQIKDKANKNEVFSMVNMGQDIKEAMTGGSVAVVDKDSILNENIVNGQVSVEKVDFASIKGNLIDLDRLTNNTCILQTATNFETQTLSNYSTTHKIIVAPNTTYTIEEDTINGVLFNEYDINGNSLVYRHFSLLKVKSLTFTTTENTRYIMISFNNSVKNNVYFNIGDTIVKTPYSINFDDNVNVVKKEELNEIKSKIDNIDNIDVSNIDYNYFAQIKNGFLVCEIPSTTKVSYNGLDIGDTGRVHKFLVQLAFENKPTSNPATATLISTRLGYRYVSNITDKSLHICFGQDSMHIDLFEGGTMNTFGSYTYSTPCLKDGETLYKIGWEYVDEDNVKVYMPDGTTQNFTMPDNKKVSDYAGRYNIIEHFTQYNDGANVSGAMFKKIALWRNDDTYIPLIFDDFEKANGSIGVTRSGHTYHQMLLNNSNYADF